MICFYFFAGITTLCAAFLSTLANANLQIETCPDSVDLFGFRTVHLPGIAVPGEDITVSIHHVPKRVLTKGTLIVTLDVEGVSAASQSFELCSLSSCAIPAHIESEISFDFHVPYSVPAGYSTSLKIVVHDHIGAHVSCISAENMIVGDPDMAQVSFVTSNKSSRIRANPLSDREAKFLFSKWRAEYGTVEPHEFSKRLQIFKQNFHSVAEHNRRDDSTYSLHLNQFAAYSQQEFSKTHFGLRQSNVTLNKKFYEKEIRFDLSGVGIGESSLPSEVDWTKKGAVTPVKDQGSCGSCWAFSTTGALEGAYFIKTGKLVSFSEQNLVNCDKIDLGCDGGSMDQADMYIQSAGGLCREEDSPYSGKMGKCTPCKKVPDTVPNYVVDVANSEFSLEAAIAKTPVSVAIEADQLAFQFYMRGILTGRCGTTLDHGVLAVGYGTLKGVHYYKVKNSWGPSYGMNGYVLIERGKPKLGGQCGILLMASYPVL